MCTQVVHCLDRIPAAVKEKPDLKDAEPFKTVLSGNREAIEKLSLKDLETILVATLTGMTVDEFKADVSKWLATAKHPRWNRLYTELTRPPDAGVYHRRKRARGWVFWFCTTTRCANMPRDQRKDCLTRGSGPSRRRCTTKPRRMVG